MPFTPRQLEGIDGYTVEWSGYSKYHLRVKRVVTTKFLGFLWPVETRVTDTYSYDGVPQDAKGKTWVRPEELKADIAFLDNLIANMWRK